MIYLTKKRRFDNFVSDTEPSPLHFQFTDEIREGNKGMTDYFTNPTASFDKDSGFHRMKTTPRKRVI